MDFQDVFVKMEKTVFPFSYFFFLFYPPLPDSYNK